MNNKMIPNIKYVYLVFLKIKNMIENQEILQMTNHLYEWLKRISENSKFKTQWKSITTIG